MPGGRVTHVETLYSLHEVNGEFAGDVVAPPAAGGAPREAVVSRPRLIFVDVVLELVEGVAVEAVGAGGSIFAVELSAFVVVDEGLVGPAWSHWYCLASIKVFWAMGSGFLSGWYFWAMAR
jgi:hypothetical protein